MRICFITPTLAIGGYEKFLINLIRGINKEHEIYVIAMNGVGGNRNEFIKLATLEDLKCDRARNACFKLGKTLKKINPDIVYTSFINFNIIVFLSKLILKMKFKIVIGEHLLTKIRNKGEKIILKYIYNKSDVIVAVSKFAKKNLVDNLEIKEEKIKVIYNPIINEEFLKNYNENYNHKWLNKEYISIVLLGRLEKDKGFQYILEAFSMIEDKKNIRIIIIGDGSYKKDLQNLSLEKGINKFVDFIGFIQNPLKVLKKADIHLVMSDYETFGNTVVEALYCYCKVITYRGIGGPEEILEDIYGKIIDKRSVEEIKKILEKNGKKEEEEKLRKKALFYNENKIINQYKILFNESLEERW